MPKLQKLAESRINTIEIVNNDDTWTLADLIEHCTELGLDFEQVRIYATTDGSFGWGDCDCSSSLIVEASRPETPEEKKEREEMEAKKAKALKKEVEKREKQQLKALQKKYPKKTKKPVGSPLP